MAGAVQRSAHSRAACTSMGSRILIVGLRNESRELFQAMAVWSSFPHAQQPYYVCAIMDLCSFLKGKVKAVGEDDARAQFSQQLEVCKTMSIICVLLAGLTFPAILVTHDDGTRFSAVEQALHIVSGVTSFLSVLSTVGFALQALLFSDILGLMNDPIDGGGEASVPGIAAIALGVYQVQP